MRLQQGRGGRRHVPGHRQRPGVQARVGAVLALTGLALAACSSSHNPSSGRSGTPRPTSSSSAVAYATCMRSHGVPSYPDPDSDGNLTKAGAQQLGVSDSQLQTARQACHALLPTGGSVQNQARQCSLTGDCPPALVQQMLSGGRVLAQCMRSHGVTKWPDPTIGPNGSPYFDVSASGLTRAYTHSSQVEHIAGQCGNQPGAVALPMG